MVLCILFTIESTAELINVSDAIKAAREQEVLTQQLLKDYCMVGMKNQFNNAKKRAREHIAHFEKNIGELDDFATSKEAFKSSEKTAKLWEPIKKLLFAEKSWVGAQEIQKGMREMLVVNRVTTKIYTVQTGLMLGEVINAAVDIEVNSQKMAMLYLMSAWGIYDASMESEMKSTIKEFEASVKMLKGEKVNTPKMLAKLKEVERDFLYFKMMDVLGSRSIPTLIYKKSNTILKSARELAAAYDKSIILN
jgi:hypothetical protein